MSPTRGSLRPRHLASTAKIHMIASLAGILMQLEKRDVVLMIVSLEHQFSVDFLYSLSGMS